MTNEEYVGKGKFTIPQEMLDYKWNTSGQTFLKKNEDETYTPMYHPSGCRSYLQCYKYHVEKNSDYEVCPTVYLDEPLDENSTLIGIFQSHDGTKENILKNLHLLHERETEAGVSLTKVLFVKGNEAGKYEGMVFIGDKEWSSNLWKLSIYSFYLKALTYSGWILDRSCNPDYGVILKENEPKFLSKVRGFYKEKCGSSYDAVHGKSGFVSICQGYNTYMKNLLLGE